MLGIFSLFLILLGSVKTERMFLLSLYWLPPAEHLERNDSKWEPRTSHHSVLSVSFLIIFLVVIYFKLNPKGAEKIIFLQLVRYRYQAVWLGKIIPNPGDVWEWVARCYNNRDKGQNPGLSWTWLLVLENPTLLDLALHEWLYCGPLCLPLSPSPSPPFTPSPPSPHLPLFHPPSLLPLLPFPLSISPSPSPPLSVLPGFILALGLLCGAPRLCLLLPGFIPQRDKIATNILSSQLTKTTTLSSNPMQPSQEGPIGPLGPLREAAVWF